MGPYSLNLKKKKLLLHLPMRWQYYNFPTCANVTTDIKSENLHHLQLLIRQLFFVIVINGRSTLGIQISMYICLQEKKSFLAMIRHSCLFFVCVGQRTGQIWINYQQYNKIPDRVHTVDLFILIPAPVQINLKCLHQRHKHTHTRN